MQPLKSPNGALVRLQDLATVKVGPLYTRACLAPIIRQGAARFGGVGWGSRSGRGVGNGVRGVFCRHVQACSDLSDLILAHTQLGLPCKARPASGPCGLPLR